VQQRYVLADDGLDIEIGILDHVIHDALGTDKDHSLDIRYIFAQLSEDLLKYGLFRILQIQRCCGWAGGCSPPGVRTEIASSGLILGVIKKRSSLVVLTVAVSLTEFRSREDCPDRELVSR